MFISYSRADADFARLLNKELQLHGKTTWFDQESIASGADFAAEIKKGIENADNFVFIISPQSVRSPYCAGETDYARSLNKRFLTVLYEEVDPTELHPALAAVQWIDFRPKVTDYHAAFSELIRTLDTDREHVAQHTKLLHRAKEWIGDAALSNFEDLAAVKGRDEILLRGGEFDAAQNWLRQALQNTKQPVPNELQKLFIRRSNEALLAATRKEIEYTRKLEKALAEARANNLTFHAEKLMTKDPTTVLRLTEAAMILHPNEMTAQVQRDIYTNHILSRIVARQESEIYCAVFSPDGQTILASSWDQTARLWDRSGQLLQTLTGHESYVWRVAFSPDGQTILTGSLDQTARLWDRSGQLLQTLTGHKEAVWSVAFSPDGQTILTGSGDKTARLWDRSGQLLQTLTGHKEAVWSVAFSPDGQTILTGSGDKTARRWDRSGQLLQTLTGHEDIVSSVAFSPDGQTILTGSLDKTARLWDRSGRFIRAISIDEPVFKGVFSPDGKYIATASAGKTFLWNLSGDRLACLKGHDSQKSINSIDFSPDGMSLLTASLDGTIRLWPLPAAPVVVFTGHEAALRAATFSPDGAMILTGSDDKTARLWDRSGQLLQTLTGHESLVSSVAFSPDGQTILTGSRDKTARLWDLQGRLLQTFSHPSAVYGAAFSPDGQLILTGSADRIARLWNRTGQCIRQFEGHSGLIYAVAFSPNGNRLLTASTDKTVRLWRVTGELVTLLKGHEDGVHSIAFSPDGQSILTGSRDRTARLWDLQGRQWVVFKGHEDGLFGVAFSPDGKYVLTGAADFTTRVWDLQGHEILLYRDHSGSVSAVAFSPDGQYILSGSADKTARLRPLKPPLAEFQQQNQYEPLSVSQRLQYDLLSADEIQHSDDPVALLAAAKFYLDQAEAALELTAQQTHFQQAQTLFDRLLDGRYTAPYPPGQLYQAYQKLNRLALNLAKVTSAGSADPEDIDLRNQDNLRKVGYDPAQSLNRTLDEYERLAQQVANDPLRNYDVAFQCTNFAWYLLKENQAAPALRALQIGQQADATYRTIYRYLPLACLLNNDYAGAEKLYREYKDQLYDQEPFSKAFLEDIKTLEDAGISHPDFAKARALLGAPADSVGK